MNSKTRSLRHWLVFALMLISALTPALALAGVAQAQDEPVRAAVTDPYWVAAYFKNTSLAGAPVLIRNEPNLDNNWGTGGPEGLQNDFFSARYTRYILTEAGVYRFTATSDDGIRIWVNDVLILDQWREQAERTFVVDRSLSAGHQLVRVEYFEATGSARVKVSWEKVGSGTVPPTGSSFRGEYFNNRDLAGSPTLARNDANINFNWGQGSPDPSISNDNFSVRWNRTLDFAAGNYRFTTTSDDGVRVWVNNALIIDQWREQSARTFSGEIFLPGGLVPVRVEYFEATQSASIQFSWQLLGSGGGGGSGGGSGGGDSGGSSCEQDSRWRSEFWNNDRFSGNPVVTRRDDRIDFNWGLGSPDPAINNDFFTARFTRRICVGEGRTRFVVEVDDGARLFVDGRLLIDSWIPQARNRYEASINLDEGRHTVVLEYLERTSLAEVFLRIDAPAPPNPPRPIGNLITCVPPQPQNNAFVRLYRLDGNNRWVSMGRGSASIVPSGFLKIDGLPVDTGRFGDQGEPYKIQIFWDGQVVRSTGDFLAGEPEFRMRPFVDNQTSWGCFH